MKRKIESKIAFWAIVLLFMLGTFVESAKAPEVEWEKTFGGKEDEATFSVQQTSDGGYILAGYASSASGNGGALLIKTDSKGNEEWNKTFGSGNDIFRSVQQTSDGGYILSGVTTVLEKFENITYPDSALWLVKTDSKGNEEWNKTFVGGSFGYSSVQQTSDGGYIVTGEFINGAYTYLWLIKTDSEGNEQWNKTFYIGSWNRGHSVQQTSDGGYIAVGSSYMSFKELNDVVLIKTNSEGDMEWYNLFWLSNETSQVGYGVQQTSDGGYIIAGTVETPERGKDAWFIKTDSKGYPQWNRTFGGGKDDEAFSLQRTSDGGYMITGWTESYGAGENDVWLIKTDSKGNEQWNRTFGGRKDDMAFSLQRTSDGGYIISGLTESYGAGGSDVWLIKFKPE